MTKVQTAPVSVEQNTEIFINYLKENSKVFETEKIKEIHFSLQGSSKENLKTAIYLGGLFEGAKARFLSAEAKQARKNLGLKVSVKYFLEQNFSLSEGYINKLIKGYTLKEQLDEYLNTGHVGKSISIDNFITFCNPKKETETTEAETTETTEAETTEAETTESEQTAFGGITLTINKASREDILKAIEYLQNKVK